MAFPPLASQMVRAFTMVKPASVPIALPAASLLAPAIASGHALPSRNRGELSFPNTTCAGGGDVLSMIGAPNPIVPKTIELVDATFAAASRLVQSLLGRCIRRRSLVSDTATT